MPRAKMEDAFAEILQSLQPTKGLFDLAKAMLRDAWDMRLQAAQAAKQEWERQLAEAEKQINGLLDRIVDATNPAVIGAYEQRIAKLERERLVLAERASQTVPAKGRLEDCIELALKFLSSPWKIYEKGSFIMRQTVLRLAFAEPLRYSPKGVYGTPELSFPFSTLGEISGQKSEMVL